MKFNMKTIFNDTTRYAPALSALTIFILLSLIPKIGAMLLDDRLLHGVNIWSKPIKFDILVKLDMLLLESGR